MSAIMFVREWPVEGGPDGMAVSPDGIVYVVDKGNGRVQAFHYS